MKRILSALLTLVMALSLTVPALASGYTDVPGGASRESIVSWINGLGLEIEAK